jgi:hypothetical protein
MILSIVRCEAAVSDDNLSVALCIISLEVHQIFLPFSQLHVYTKLSQSHSDSVLEIYDLYTFHSSIH